MVLGGAEDGRTKTSKDRKKRLVSYRIVSYCTSNHSDLSALRLLSRYTKFSRCTKAVNCWLTQNFRAENLSRYWLELERPSENDSKGTDVAHGPRLPILPVLTYYY